MKIFLINPIVRAESPPAYFPLGLASVAGSLIAGGHEVEVFDINANRWSPYEVQEKLKLASFDIVGLTGLITEYNQIKWLATHCKSYHPDKPIILGGGLATSVPQVILEKTVVDIVVIGEGELTAVSLLKAIENDQSLEEVGGIGFLKENKAFFTPKCLPVHELDELPSVAWDYFPTDIYAKGEKVGFEFPLRAINVLSGRGCPYQCSYCYHGIFGYKYRARCPQEVIGEMLGLREQYHLDGFLFSDDTFTINRSWLEEFCHLMTDYQGEIKWACNGRVNTVDDHLLATMSYAGCFSIFYGIESGSQKILNEMNKNITVDQATRAIILSRNAGLEVSGYFIIGSPGETKKTIWETVEFCKRNELSLNFGFATPLPGTKWFEIAKSQGKISDIEKLITRWPIWNEGFLVNLSSLSDQELLRLKYEAESAVESTTGAPTSMASLAGRWSRFRKLFGWKMLVLKFIYKLLRLTFIRWDPFTAMQNRARNSYRGWKRIIRPGIGENLL